MREYRTIFLSILLLLLQVYPPVFAEEVQESDPYDLQFVPADPEVRYQLSYEELFQDGDPSGSDDQQTAEEMPLQLMANGKTPKLGSRLARYKANTPWGYSYITMLLLDGQPVFCIEPEVQFKIVDEYTPTHVDYTSYFDLNYQERYKLWQIVKYGYSYPGHQSNDWYVATQLYIWQTLTKREFITMTTDGSELNTDYYKRYMQELDATIEANRNKAKPSFANTTVTTRLNQEVVLQDSNQVISNYTVEAGKGLEASIDNNTLKLKVTSRDFEPQLKLKSLHMAEDALIAYANEDATGHGQMVIDIVPSYDPVADFSLRIDLLKNYTLMIIKTDAETGSVPQGDATLQNAVFRVYDTDALGVDLTVTTDENGVAEAKDLPLGHYMVEEISAPTGYQLSTDVYGPIDLAQNDQTITVTNQVKKGRVAVRKSIDTVFPDIDLSGFTFAVINQKGETVTTLTTDEFGYAVSVELPYGSYKLKEEKKEGYYLLDELPFVIDGSEDVVEVQAVNREIYAKLKLIKTDEESGKVIPAANVRFRLYNAQGETVTVDGQDSFVTDEKGEAVWSGYLPHGTYELEELDAPNGYVRKAERVTVTVDDSVDPETHEVLISFANTPQVASLEIEKYGEMLSGVTEEETPYGILRKPVFEEHYLSGAVLQLLAGEDIVKADGSVLFEKGSLVKEVTTRDDGPITMDALPLGKYILKEVSAPEGYVLEETEHEIDLEYTSQEERISLNSTALYNTHQRAKLTVMKEMEPSHFRTPEEVSKVVFTLHNKNEITENGITIPADSLLGILRCDAEGNAEAEVCLSGEYYLKEAETSEYYQLKEEEIPLTYSYQDTKEAIIPLTLQEPLKNELKKGSLAVYKTDEFGNKASGATFTLAADPDFETIIETKECSEDGIAYFDNLEIGTYYVKEIRCDEIFELSTDVTPVEIKFHEESEITLRNYYKPVSVNFRKWDENHKKRNGSEMMLFQEVKEAGENTVPLLFVKEGCTVDLSSWFNDENFEITSGQSHATLAGTVLCMRKQSVLELNHKYWIIGTKDLEENVKLVHAKIADKQYSGEIILHFADTESGRMPLNNVTVTLYSDKDCKNAIKEITTDEYGNAARGDLADGTYYYPDGSGKIHSLTLGPKEDGLAVFSELQRMQTYYLVETGLPEGYDYLDNTYVRIDTETEDDLLEAEMVNTLRTIDLTVRKTDEKEEELLLNGALFEVYDLSENRTLGTYASGGIYLKTQEEAAEYEVSRSADFSEIIGLLKGENHQILCYELEGTPLEGTYYLRNKNQPDTVVPVTVSQGSFTLEDIPYAHEVELVEIKAPQGYQITESTMHVSMKAPYDTDEISTVIGNRKIILYRMGE